MTVLHPAAQRYVILPDGRAFMRMPKCASKSLMAIATERREIETHGAPKVIHVVIRDPWERYVSGVRQWMNDRAGVLKNLEHDPCPDEHTMPQSELMLAFGGVDRVLVPLWEIEAHVPNIPWNGKINEEKRKETRDRLAAFGRDWMNEWERRFSGDYALYDLCIGAIGVGTPRLVASRGEDELEGDVPTEG